MASSDFLAATWGAVPVRKRGPVRMQHEGLRRRRRSSAQGLGTPPTATFDRESGWVRASLSQSGATRTGSGKQRPFQTCGRRGKSRQSEVQKEKVRLRQRIRRWGTKGLCARARTVANPRQELKSLRAFYHFVAQPSVGVQSSHAEGGPLSSSANRRALQGACARRLTRAARGRRGRVPDPGFIKARSGPTRALVALAVPAALT